MSEVNERYCEAHITVKPGELDHWQGFADDANEEGWKASKFDVDEVDGAHGMWFLSVREKGPDAEKVLKGRIKYMIMTLRDCDLGVVRWKIERTLLDSKLGDTEDML